MPPRPPYPEEDVLLLAGGPSAVAQRHVLGVADASPVQEEDSLGRVLLLQPVQEHLHAEGWPPPKQKENVKAPACRGRRHRRLLTEGGRRPRPAGLQAVLDLEAANGRPTAVREGGRRRRR